VGERTLGATSATTFALALGFDLPVSTAAGEGLYLGRLFVDCSCMQPGIGIWIWGRQELWALDEIVISGNSAI
jgi:hypothetical protein